MQRLSLFVEYDAAIKTLALHDVIRAYLLSQMADASVLHAKLVDAWGDPQRLSDDYAWRWYVYHLKEAGRYNNVLQVVDKPFLAAKIRHFRSYSAVFDDLRTALSAAETMGNRSRMLGLALAHSGFQTKLVQLGNNEVIPLYARFGEVARALEFARAIEDPNKQAETLVKIAREVRTSDSVQARQLVQEVLSRWKSYEPGYTFGQILCQILEIFPEAIIGFLEQVEDFTPTHSLGHSSFGIAYEQIDILALKLPIELQTRLMNALIKNLPLAEYEHLQNELRCLLARVIPDPDTAKTFADDQVSQLIVAVKTHIAQKEDAPLPPELIEHTMKVFVQEATQDEKDVLYRYIISPCYMEFSVFASTTNSPNFALNIDKRIRLLLDLTYRLIKIDAHFDEAQKLLLQALELNATLKGLDATITRNSQPGSFGVILEWMVEGLAARDLPAALDFLKLPSITQVLHEREASRLPVRAIAAAAKTQPREALHVADGLGYRQKEWSRAFIAEGLASSDLAQAVSIWRELDADEIDKPELLIKILGNASLKDYSLAQTLLTEEFRSEQAQQLYKVPALLDIAVRCYRTDPNKARLIGEQVRELLYRLDRERQGKVLKEFFILPLIRPMVLCGRFQLAWGWTHQLSDDSGLEAVACAEILETLVKHPDLIDDDIYHHLQLLLNTAADKWKHGRGHSGGFSDLVLDFAENLQYEDDTRLISIYLQTYSGRHRQMLDWSPDYVKTIIAPKLALYDTDAAWRVVEEIQDTELRIFAKVDLYNGLPVADISALRGLGDNGLLLAIAYLRVAKHTDSEDRKHQFIEDALAQISKRIPHSLDDLGLRLAVQFVRELSRLDPVKSIDVSHQLVNAVMNSTRGSLAHLVYSLCEAGYIFTEAEKTALGQMSSLWLDQLEAAAPQYGGMHEQLAGVYGQIGRFAAPVDIGRGLSLFENARRHANLETNSGNRRQARIHVLKNMLLCGNPELWKIALTYSLEFGETIFETFYWFGHGLLEFNDDTQLHQLPEAIRWAEDAMNL
jgi:hypothetical protein